MNAKMLKMPSKLQLAIAISAVLMSGLANAEAWDITQTVTPGSDTTLLQDGTTATSVQAMNAISSTTATVSGSQTAAMGLSALTLDQEGTGTGSTQAANYLNSTVIGATGVPFVQAQSGTGTITLNQTTALGATNLQAVNTAGGTTVTALTQDVGAAIVALNQTQSEDTQAVNNIDATDMVGPAVADVAQTVSPGTSLTLSQTGSGTNNTQAGNRAAVTGATGALSATQLVAPGASLTLTQTETGSGNTQAANLADSAYEIGTLSQTVTGGSAATAMDQDGAGVNTQALNMATAGDGGVTTSTTQAVTGDLTMQQGVASAVGDGSVQAANYLVSTGTVVLATQSLGGGSEAISLEQNASGTGSVQAGNLMDFSAASAELTDGAQSIDGASLDLNQHDTTAGALQAGNAVLTGGTGGTIAQTVTVDTLTMAQTNAVGSFQAANYVGDLL